MSDLVERLREVSSEKQSEAWGRLDGGQDLSIGAMLADEAAARIATLEAQLAAAAEALDDAKALNECACGHDSPNDICMAHIAILNRVRADHPAFERARADAIAGVDAQLAAAVDLAEAVKAMLTTSDPGNYDRIVATLAAFRATQGAKHMTAKCPRCGSSAPHMHPAVQHEGEVQICTDDYHLTPTNQNTAKYIAGVLAYRAIRGGGNG